MTKNEKLFFSGIVVFAVVAFSFIGIYYSHTSTAFKVTVGGDRCPSRGPAESYKLMHYKKSGEQPDFVVELEEGKFLSIPEWVPEEGFWIQQVICENGESHIEVISSPLRQTIVIRGNN